jgi:hypothetical protein
MHKAERLEGVGRASSRVEFGQRDSDHSTHNSQRDQAQHIATVRKNALEEIRIELSEFNGHDLVNVRVWAEPRGGGTDRIPTKAGIACNVRLLPELIEALQQAEMAARNAGLLS